VDGVEVGAHHEKSNDGKNVKFHIGIWRIDQMRLRRNVTKSGLQPLHL